LAGAQARLQHSPPQAGMPLAPASATTPPHATPATVQPVVPGAWGSLQRPSAAPAAFVQTPPQQSPEFPQASPFWMQNEEARTQVPLVHNLEQHSPWAAHELPAVLQDPLSAAQAPPVHAPPQQAPLSVQGCPSDVHWVELHAPLTQLSVAQSVFALQPPPAATGLAKVDVQTCKAASHSPEQHVSPVAHDSPAVPHVAAEPSRAPPSFPEPPPLPVVSIAWVPDPPQPIAASHAAQITHSQVLLIMRCLVMARSTSKHRAKRNPWA
jgi:hypothetical protein